MLRTTSNARAYLDPEEWRELVRLCAPHKVQLSAKHPKGPYCARVGGSEPVWGATATSAVTKALA